MKFVSISRTKDIFYLLPAEEQMELTRGALHYVEKYRKQGKFTDVLIEPNLKQTISIVEASSHEEATRMAMENPLSRYQDIEFRPVVDFDEGLRVGLEIMGQMMAVR